MSAHERFDLSGRTALITGGSRGIGRGIAIGLAQHGADVAIVYRSAEREANEVVEAITSLGRRAWAERYDLAETDGLADLAARTWDATGGGHVLINNAGLGYLEHFNRITPETWNRTMAVNVDAVFRLSQAMAERMIAGGIQGRIINLSSVNGLVAEAGLAHYNASKGAVEMLSQSLAIELGPHGITVNTICPGIIETEIGGEFDIDVEAFCQYFKAHVPLGQRFGEVEDCVGAAVLLASRAGAYITGQRIVIDGGVMCEQVPRIQFMPRYRNTLTAGD
ncbi:MAG: gluconate 5-dehydrogenase [Phycisphaeraceae bacterium]|nr:gluconate 5-dehydrogenase [Phycisphaeraceae bacterium]